MSTHNKIHIKEEPEVHYDSHGNELVSEDCSSVESASSE